MLHILAARQQQPSTNFFLCYYSIHRFDSCRIISLAALRANYYITPTHKCLVSHIQELMSNFALHKKPPRFGISNCTRHQKRWGNIFADFFNFLTFNWISPRNSGLKPACGDFQHLNSTLVLAFSNVGSVSIPNNSQDLRRRDFKKRRTWSEAGDELRSRHKTKSERWNENESRVLTGSKTNIVRNNQAFVVDLWMKLSVQMFALSASGSACSAGIVSRQSNRWWNYKWSDFG